MGSLTIKGRHPFVELVAELDSGSGSNLQKVWDQAREIGYSAIRGLLAVLPGRSPVLVTGEPRQPSEAFMPHPRAALTFLAAKDECR